MSATVNTERARPLAVVPCGTKKSRQPAAPAGELYLGGYHQACRRAAAALTTPDRTLILSALHGLLPLDRVIAPYELRMGQPGSVTTDALREQAADLGLLDEQDVVVLGGRAYTTAALAVWPHASTPLRGLSSMGAHLAVLAGIARSGLARAC